MFNNFNIIIVDIQMQSRNKKYLIFYVILIIISITMFLITTLTGSSALMKYIPFNNFFLENTYNYIILPLFAAFFGFCIAYILSPLMLFFHKKIVGRKYNRNNQAT